MLLKNYKSYSVLESLPLKKASYPDAVVDDCYQTLKNRYSSVNIISETRKKSKKYSLFYAVRITLDTRIREQYTKRKSKICLTLNTNGKLLNMTKLNSIN